MNKERLTETDQDNKRQEAQNDSPVNPFDKAQASSAEKETNKEEAIAEQQRKEALTERD